MGDELCWRRVRGEVESNTTAVVAPTCFLPPAEACVAMRAALETTFNEREMRESGTEEEQRGIGRKRKPNGDINSQGGYLIPMVFL